MAIRVQRHTNASEQATLLDVLDVGQLKWRVSKLLDTVTMMIFLKNMFGKIISKKKQVADKMHLKLPSVQILPRVLRDQWLSEDSRKQLGCKYWVSFECKIRCFFLAFE